MTNVAARTIHVGDRYEALTPVEKIEALVANERYPTLLEGEVRMPDPGSGHLVVGGFLAFMAFWVFTLTADSDVQAIGMAFAGTLLIGGGGVAILKPGRLELGAAELIPACVRIKDYVSLASGADPAAGCFAVELITQDGDLLQVELSQHGSDMLAVGDVGVAGLRGGRLIEFRMLDERVPASHVDDLEAGAPGALAGWPVTDPQFDPRDDRGAMV